MTPRATANTHLPAAYRTQSENSSPGALGALYDSLQPDIPSLCRVVQNVLVHLFWIRESTYGVTLSRLKAAGRRLYEEFGIVTMEERLQSILALQEAPLADPRDPTHRSVGCCRDFALTLVSILRHKGIPARVRTGVALYLDPVHPEDHYVAEWWSESDRRWHLVDPQIDDVQRAAMRIHIDTTALPPGSFLTGWQLLDAMRSGTIANADRIGFPPDNVGITYGRNKLFADFVSLIGQEVPVHAWWGIGTPGDVESGDEALLDRMLALLQGIDRDDPEALREARRLGATHPRLRMPDGYRIPPWAPEPGWGLDI
ncbi:MAG: transglutaminase-like domain-containing protein [Candidatus Bipolaricaulia bacterium]